MTTPTDGSRDPYQRFWEQFAEVQRVHAGLTPPVTYLVEPAEATPGSGIAPLYVYESRAVLVREADMPQIRRHTAAPDLDVPGVPGVRKLLLEEGVHVPTEVDRLNRAAQGEPGAGGEPGASGGDGEPGGDGGGHHGGGPARRVASPNHLVTIAPVNLCPAGEPHPRHTGTPLWPYPHDHAAGTAGAGVTILVIDTGLQADFTAELPAFNGVTAVPNEQARVPVDPATGLIKEYAGHGTFVTGVLRSVAPGADVHVSSALQNAGALDEGKLCRAILTAIDNLGQWPDIISLSAGTPSQDNQDLMSLGPLYDQLDTEHPQTVLVAAAGNDGTSERLFWPAASARTRPGVISVGALRRDGQGRGCFSNYGDWVTVYAYGEQVINVFRSGPYAYQHESTPACRYRTPPLYPKCGCVSPHIKLGEQVTFDGLAAWSGTSFATPLVAGMIAAQMTETPTSNARAAARDLLLSQRATTVLDKGDQEKLLTLR